MGEHRERGKVFIFNPKEAKCKHEIDNRCCFATCPGTCNVTSKAEERRKALASKADKELTLDDLGRHGWEEAMALRLPRYPDRELLEKARDDVIQYLNYWTEKVAYEFMQQAEMESEIKWLTGDISYRLWEILIAYCRAVERDASTPVDDQGSEPEADNDEIPF
jgi:hypothetical protein